jgi:hypothetical protein
MGERLQFVARLAGESMAEPNSGGVEAAQRIFGEVQKQISRHKITLFALTSDKHLLSDVPAPKLKSQ